MCTYCSTNKYRKIYENHIGSIPKEANGRTYEIHHIDGNHSNNDPSNLQAVTIQEHYDIHYAHGDWAACHRIAIRLNQPPAEISELSKRCQNERIKNGTHNFIKNNPVYSRVKNGSHNFLGGEQTRINNKKMFENGTHPFLNVYGENNPRFNPIIYNFENITTGQKISMTQHEFVKTFPVNHGAISMICSGKRKSHKNWKIAQ